MKNAVYAVAPVLFVVQAIILLFYFVTDIAPYPPEASDQALYLVQSYDLTASGLRAIGSNVFAAGAQSALFFAEGALLNTIFRLPRFSEILLNYSMLVAIEVAIFLTVRRLTQNLPLALFAVGLLLSTHTLWFWAGGLFDFRIDWLASCAYGLWCCVVLRSGVFYSRKWTAITVLAACFLVLNRYVTSTYVLGVEIPLLIISFMYELLFSRLQRTINIAISIVAQIVIVSPFIYRNWQSIENYYVVGHLTGNEKEIRALEFGVTDLFSNLTYYPVSIYENHLGAPFAWMAFVFIVFVLLALMLCRTTNGKWPFRAVHHVRNAYEAIFLLGAICAPIAVLTSDLSKSPVVGGVVDVPVILFLIFTCRWLGVSAELRNSYERNSVKVSVYTVATCFLVVGLLVQAYNSLATRRIAQRTDLQKWALNVQHVVLDAVSDNRTNVNITSNVISPHTIPPVFTAVADEMRHGDVQFHSSYVQTIFAPSWEEYLGALKASDYFIFSTSPKALVYPVSRFFAEHDAEIKIWVEAHMDKIMELQYDDGVNQTFKRRPDFIQEWVSGSYGQERLNDRRFQWEKSDAALKVSKANVPCLILPVFAMGPDHQVLKLKSSLGLDLTLDLAGSDVWHPINIELRLPFRDREVIYAFHALEPSGHFPNDSKEIAFGADQAHGGDCPAPN